eukprot:jgi/Ulvmu1/12714/UM095_0018.1
MTLPYKESVPGWDRVESATKSGLGFGALIGAVRGNWDFNIVKNETSLGALGKSATTMGSTMLVFGSVAFTYAACEAALESFRGEADWKNGALAGFAAGSVIGIRNGSIGAAATTGMMFAAASMAVDACSGRERVNIFAQDPTPVNPYANRIVLPKY